MTDTPDEAHETGSQTMLRDPRSTGELIALSLLELTDDDEKLSQIPAWAADSIHGAYSSIAVLHARGDQEALDAALHLCDSERPLERRLGAKILGELGGNRPFREEGCDRLLDLLANETDGSVLLEAVYAFGHLNARWADKMVATFASHPDPSIRRATAFALNGTIDPDGIHALLVLMQEPEAETRDWATTGIGQQTKIDGPGIRAALLGRSSDEDAITRAEALHGLARRQDGRAVFLLIEELQQQVDRAVDDDDQRHDYLFREAACTMLSWPEDNWRQTDVAALIASLRALQASTG
jgi:HEAT repeat protein